MAYIRKIIGQDEHLHGIARLHWIYIVQGLGWFLALAGGGWLLNTVLTRVALMVGNSFSSPALPLALLNISNGVMWFLVAGGFAMFFFMVLKVLVTEIGLSNRRIMHKTGLVFVKVKQIDLEEIRGENLDLGHLGRLLGYGYLFLDCRFIGDVRLPAIENPERFLKALHMARSKSQDSLSVVLGKGNAAPLEVAVPQGQTEIPQPNTPQPEIQPPQPGPEINPPSTPQPEIAPQPVPHGPPPGGPAQPAQPPATPTPPQQPVEAPPPAEPPLQPPGGAQAVNVAALDPSIVKQVIEQAMPQMAQQVAKELADKGLVAPVAPEQHAVDNDLIASFDEAALDEHKRGPHDHRHSLEHSVH